MAHNSQSVYRPDIDGLCVIAVLAVSGNHAFPGIITGGYVGVAFFCNFWIPDFEFHRERNSRQNFQLCRLLCAPNQAHFPLDDIGPVCDAWIRISAWRGKAARLTV